MFSLLVLAAALVPRLAAAGARDLDYRAPAGCPSEADVASSLQARAPTGRDARIDVSSDRAGFRGELVVGAGEHRLARSVQARTCAAVVEALTIVIVLDHESDVSVEDVPVAVAAHVAARAETPASPSPRRASSSGPSTWGWALRARASRTAPYQKAGSFDDAHEGGQSSLAQSCAKDAVTMAQGANDDIAVAAELSARLFAAIQPDR